MEILLTLMAVEITKMQLNKKYTKCSGLTAIGFGWVDVEKNFK